MWINNPGPDIYDRSRTTWQFPECSLASRRITDVIRNLSIFSPFLSLEYMDRFCAINHTRSKNRTTTFTFRKSSRTTTGPSEMEDAGALALEPPEPPAERGLHLPLHRVRLVPRHPPPPLHLWVVEATRADPGHSAASFRGGRWRTRERDR
jgi:hypothetical protein